MERDVMTALMRWKESSHRKPLILKGARQVGKTYILRELGRRAYRQTVYFNFDDDEQLKTVFAADYDMDRIIRSLSAISGVSITPGDTLIILDEIQEVPRGLASLKYFCEKAPQYHVAVAGSLLGIALHADVSFPVGKVDMLELYPMTFDEFLSAMGKTALREALETADRATAAALHDYYVELLRQYYYVGGMPEAVSVYAETGDVWQVRTVQRNILEAYRNDIGKHAPSREVPRINMVWRSVVSQLARKNKKFIFSALRKGARAADFEMAIQWLIDAGLIHKVSRVRAVGMPLKFYEDLNAFKLFFLDCGLLAALAETPPDLMLVGNDVFKEYKGAFTENYVLQQLLTLPDTFVYYYANERSTLEIDFLVQHGVDITPVEVKAEVNLRAKSLRQFVTDHPDLSGMRFSMAGYQEQDGMTNVPLFAVRHAW